MVMGAVQVIHHDVHLRRLRTRRVWTPTEASWLNAIEAHFGVLKRATLTGSDDATHIVRRRRIYRYLRYRNRRAGRLHHPLTRIRSVPRWTPKTGQSWTPENRPVR
jgi:hypothetical protein